MDRENKNLVTDTEHGTPAPYFTKQIGKTTYKVRVHFSTTSRETMSDKIMRMLRNEVEQSGSD